MIYCVTGSNPLALSAGPGILAVLDGVRSWGCHNGPLSWLCGHSRFRWRRRLASVVIYDYVNPWAVLMSVDVTRFGATSCIHCSLITVSRTDIMRGGMKKVTITL